jgi:hypothetical protein
MLRPVSPQLIPVTLLLSRTCQMPTTLSQNQKASTSANTSITTAHATANTRARLARSYSVDESDRTVGDHDHDLPDDSDDGPTTASQASASAPTAKRRAKVQANARDPSGFCRWIAAGNQSTKHLVPFCTYTCCPTLNCSDSMEVVHGDLLTSRELITGESLFHSTLTNRSSTSRSLGSTTSSSRIVSTSNGTTTRRHITNTKTCSQY